MAQFVLGVFAVLKLAAEGAALLLQTLDVPAEPAEVRLEPEEHLLQTGQDEVALVHVGPELLDQLALVAVDRDAFVLQRLEFRCY